MKKTLVLVNSKKAYFFPWAQGDNFDVYSPYIYTFRSITTGKSDGIYDRCGIYDFWRYKLRLYDRVVIFGGAYTKQIGRMLVKYDFEKGVHIFHWNRMGDSPEEIKKHISVVDGKFPVYSFDKKDCEMGHVKFAQTVACSVYDETIEELQRKYKPEYDIIFAGSLKGGRVEQLESIFKELKKYNLRIWTNIGRGSNQRFSNYRTELYEILEKPRPYKDVAEMILKSKVILDVDYCNTPAVNTRIVEAFIYHKKIISTNINYMYEPFYSKDYFFIWGVDDLDRLREFIDSPYVIPNYDWANYFSFENWIEQFNI